MAKIIICIALLLGPAAALVFFMHKNKDAYMRSLGHTKSLRIFPVRSLVYTFFATMILLFGLAVADRLCGYAEYLREDDVIAAMNVEKMTKKHPYPLVALRGREPEISSSRPKILVIGDSYVWGDGSTNFNQLWWNILSSKLERRGYDCDVYAAGYPGASTYDEYVWLRESTLLEELRPDLIILGYFVNDPDLERLGMGLRHYYPFIARGPRNDNNPPKLFPSLFYFLNLKLVTKLSQTENHFNSSEFEFGYIAWTAYRLFAESPNIERFDEFVVQPLSQFVRERDIPTIVIPTPPTLYDASLFECHSRNVMPVFEQAGLPVYDPIDAFAQYNQNGRYNKHLTVSPVNMHFGPAASQFLGIYAADVLEQNYASILGEKRAKAKAYPIEINDWLPFMLEPRAIRESEHASQYVIEYPNQASAPDFENHVHGNFLTLPLRQKYVKLNFKYPVRLASVKIEGDDLLSAQVWTLAINHRLGFDDQKPVSLGKRRGAQCEWTDKSKRDVTSLLISAKTVDGKQASLTITIEGEVVF